jgi:hypothetical protein
MLSLDFGIPEDGVALTFLRAGGNPRAGGCRIAGG